MNRGFTLAETLVTIAVSVLVVGALFQMIFIFYRGNAYVIESATAVENARRGIMTSVRNIQEATYGDDGSYPISSAATSSITFFADVDTDGSVERVHLFSQNGSFYRGITNAAGSPLSYSGQTEATSTVVQYLRNATSSPIFTYYDVSGTMLSTTSTDVSDIASIRVDIFIDLNPNRAPQVYELTGSATLRNLREY